MSMKATASKVLSKSLSELTSMSDESVREKVNDMDGTKPIKYKQTVNEEIRAPTAKCKVVEDIDIFSQTLMRELPGF